MMKKKKDTYGVEYIEKLLSPFPEADADEYLRRSCLPNYIFYKRQKNGEYKGFCTCCMTEIDDFAPNGHYLHDICPHCSQEVIAYQSGRGRQRLYYSGQMSYPQQTADGGLLVRIFNFSRSYDKKRTTPFRIDFIESERYYFNFHEHICAKYTYKYDCENKQYKWFKINRRCFADTTNKGYNSFQYPEKEVSELLPHTEWLSGYGQSFSQINILRNAAAYPSLEYLHKCGHTSLVKMVFNHDINSICPAGKNISEITKLSGETLAYFKKHKGTTAYDIEALQLLQEKKDKPTAELVKRLNGEMYYMSHMYSDYKVLPKPSKLYAYLDKQSIKSGVEIRIRDYRDWLEQCKKLGYPLNNYYLMPPNFQDAHAKASVLIDYADSAKYEKQLAKRLPELEKYNYGESGYTVRAIQSIKELIHEGAYLKHCVGGYAERYAEGQTDIICIRKTDSPDTPLFTGEVLGGKLYQLRGVKNCEPPKEVIELTENAVKKAAEKSLKKERKKKSA